MYRLGSYLDPVTLTYILRSSDFDIFCVDVRYLLNYKAYSHQTLQSASPQCTDLADTFDFNWKLFVCFSNECLINLIIFFLLFVYQLVNGSHVAHILAENWVSQTQ